MKTHGLSSTRTFRLWSGMKQRCTNPNARAYRYYGGRGISFCKEWASFENFLADMGEAPDGFSLERDDVNGNYCAANCRWIPISKQASNKRTNTRFAFDGKALLAREISERTNLKVRTVRYRMKAGVPIEKPVGRDIFLAKDGLEMNLQSWAAHLGLAKSTLTMRMQKGWPLERVLSNG